MRRLSAAWIAAVSTISLAQVGFAADLPRKAPAYSPPPPPVYSWTGFYVGGNVGYSWGDARTDIAGNGSTPTFAGLVPGFPGFPSNVSFADSNIARLNGVIGGGQIGYNYQFSPKWVLGFEADIQGSGEKGSNTFADPFSAPFCTGAAATNPPTCIDTRPLIGTAATTYEAKINWFGTVRGRIGFLLTNQLLIYGTGGLAYGKVGVSGSTNISGGEINSLGGIDPFTPRTAAFSASKTNIGFSVGGGIEGNVWLPANWAWKLEYLYLDLGSLDTAASFALPGPFGTPPLTGTITTHTHFTDNIVRVGVNYKFH